MHQPRIIHPSPRPTPSSHCVENKQLSRWTGAAYQSNNGAALPNNTEARGECGDPAAGTAGMKATYMKYAWTEQQLQE